MMFNEIFNTLLSLLVTGFILSFAALVLFVLVAVLDWLRCYFHGIPFETASEEFYRFYVESFLPTMSLLFVTLMVLKFFLSTKGG